MPRVEVRNVGGISIHLTRLAAGLGFIGSLWQASDPVTNPGGFFSMNGASTMTNKIANDPATQRNLSIAGAVYVGARAVGPSVEKSPLIELGKLRIYAL